MQERCKSEGKMRRAWGLPFGWGVAAMVRRSFSPACKLRSTRLSVMAHCLTLPGAYIVLPHHPLLLYFTTVQPTCSAAPSESIYRDSPRASLSQQTPARPPTHLSLLLFSRCNVAQDANGGLKNVPVVVVRQGNQPRYTSQAYEFLGPVIRSIHEGVEGRANP